MPYTALTDDTVLDVLPDMPDETPAETASNSDGAPGTASAEPDDAENAENTRKRTPRPECSAPDAVPSRQRCPAAPKRAPLRLVGEVFKTYIITEHEQ